jgi:hypothetical protein
MELLKFDLSRLRNEEWFNLYTNLLELLEPLHGKADALLLVFRKSAHIKEMEKTDKERNAIYRGLYERGRQLRRRILCRLQSPPGFEEEVRGRHHPVGLQ